MTGIKFSDFDDGNLCQIGDKVVGLRSGQNYQFDFPSTGINDGNGNQLIAWSTVGATATNYLLFANGNSGNNLGIEALGDDSNISIDVVLKGTGMLNVYGLFNINGSNSINAIINDDTFATASATNVPTALSVKNYLASTPGTPGGTNGQIQYNDSGALGGDTITTDGSSNWSGDLALTGQLDVDNININGNTISSTDTNGDINLTPNGSGQVVLDGLGWSSLTNGQLFIGNTGSVPTAATLTAGSGIGLVNAAGSITISSTGGGGGFSWNYVSGTSSATTAANGYITDNAATVTLTLPTTIARGQGIAVQNIGAGLVRIAQNASQYIKFGASTSTVGVGGYVEVTVPINGFILLCTEANLGFCFLTPPTGALTVV